MRRLALAAASLVLVAACGTGAQTPTPQPQAQAQAQPERISPPRPGTYTYEVSAKALDPEDSERILQSVDGVEMTEEIVAGGDAYTSEITTGNAPGTVTRVRTMWEDDRVLLLSSETESGGVTTTCRFDPPVTIMPIPLQAGAIPVQTWQSDTCSGEMEVTVVGRAHVTDATGRGWEAWRIDVRTDSRSPGTTTFERETRWISAELGQEIRNERIAEGSSAGRRFNRQTARALSSHP